MGKCGIWYIAVFVSGQVVVLGPFSRIFYSEATGDGAFAEVCDVSHRKISGADNPFIVWKSSASICKSIYLIRTNCLRDK